METTLAPMHWWTTTEKYILVTTLGVIIVFGVCGNVLVVIAIIRFKRLRRAVNSYLILNLAVSDFLTASILMPFQLATVLDLNIIVDNGLLCKVGGILSYPFYICSTITLVMLAIERYIAVSDPLRYISRVTTRTITIMIVYCWTQGVVFVVLVSFSANIEFSTQSLDCGVAWEGTPLWLSILVLLFNIVLPFFLLLIMSLRVLIIAIRQKKWIDTERFSIDRTRRKKSVFTGFEGKATVAVLVVIFVFLILWIPFLITRGFMALTQIYVSPIVTTSVVWLLHLNSVVNVFIYTVRRSDYRRAFVSIIRCTSLSRSADIERTVTNIHEASSKELNLDRSSGTIQLNCTVTTIPEVT
ncbi:trace amine-associated receptor 7d-like [Stylophora pistillata]|uniref:Trace amine-associated receptor 7d n=1 Tax=Stylophora pistillata TaxID=50429 RepID=A0A2B4SY64_STYPI|nr:trace amine-associated receptor 7d-like [Stylophora pistillata]XP_022803106.1 trace amine-associated receptor 7d-like [Stylophora pistillata]XP_022803113.1 trace amine-associated receptor 7d-like [Stylophora pistillata]PFX33357.1 Trace amine-associated receptor 7d [Stylophora pistillata]